MQESKIKNVLNMDSYKKLGYSLKECTSKDFTLIKRVDEDTLKTIKFDNKGTVELNFIKDVGDGLLNEAYDVIPCNTLDNKERQLINNLILSISAISTR